MPRPIPGQDAATAQNDARRSSARPLFRLILLILLLLAFAVRLFLLDAQSIWWDEGISLHLAGADLSEIIIDRLDNIHPPLYFILLKGWLVVSGETVFSARYLSVLAGWLQVSATYAVAARWFGRRSGLVAAILASMSAVSIIYAQEVRVYSVLPLAYLALLAITHELVSAGSAAGGKKWISWLALGVVSWIAIHLHYVSLFAVGYVTVWALLSFARSRRWPAFGRVILVQFLVAVASLPWFLAAVLNRAAISSEANAGTFVTDPVPLRFLIAQVWTFYLTGLAGALSRPYIAEAAGLTALVFVLLLAARLYERRTRQAAAVLLAHWLIPLSSALLVWLVRSFSHPRYVVMFLPGFILVCACLIMPGISNPRSHFFNAMLRILSLILLLLLAVLSLWGVSRYFFDEDVGKDDIRGAALLLQETTSEGDLILVPDTDWSLPFEYQGAATVAMPGLEGDEDYWHNLAELTAGSPQVTTLDYERGTRDWQGVLPFALHKAGIRTSVTDLDALILRTYDLDQPISAPQFVPASEQFGPLELTGAWVEQGVPAADALAIALRWRLDSSGEAPQVSAALRLLDEDGRRIAAEDDRLLDSLGRPSDQWSSLEPVDTYHLLPIPPATPPLSYTVALQLYEQTADGLRPLDLLDSEGAPRGQTFHLDGIQTARQAAALPGELRLTDPSFSGDILLAPGLILREADISQQNAAAGTPLNVDLLWLADTELPDLRPQLRLVQDEKILAADDRAPAAGRYPTSSWEKGEQVHEQRTLLIPAVSAGQADLQLTLGDQVVDLGEIFIEAQAHQFERPAVDHELDAQFDDILRLSGYSLPERPVTTAESVPVTLLWEVLSDGSAVDYVVFAHLLSEDGRLIGQHDGVAAQGRRPAAGWVIGEYILDRHDLIFRDVAYEGPAAVEVGLYDPVTGERLALPNGADHVILPHKLLIEAAG